MWAVVIVGYEIQFQWGCWERLILILFCIDFKPLTPTIESRLTGWIFFFFLVFFICCFQMRQFEGNGVFYDWTQLRDRYSSFSLLRIPWWIQEQVSFFFDRGAWMNISPRLRLSNRFFFGFSNSFGRNVIWGVLLDIEGLSWLIVSCWSDRNLAQPLVLLYQKKTPYLSMYELLRARTSEEVKAQHISEYYYAGTDRISGKASNGVYR